MTNVKFLIEKPDGNLPCNVFAFFPDWEYNDIDPDIYMSYSHIGQHSGCHIDYANECKKARKKDYLPLLNELKAQGYDDLNVLNIN